MAETTKKAKAPAKPRATKSTETPAAAKDAPAEKTTARKTTAKSNTIPPRPSHEDIARLAQQYWAERGHTDGQAEQDWLRAEQELMKLAS